MKIGINTDICKKTDCKHFKNRSSCTLEKCNASKKNRMRFKTDSCPIPYKCPYKAMHVLVGGTEIVVLDWCMKKCKGLAK